jgi:hypothetical protein
MRTLCILLLIAVTVFLTSFAQAQDVVPGAIITPKGDLPLRDAAPGGLIGLKGDAIGSVTPQVEYKVIDKKSISTIFGGENWLKVQKIDDASKQGWVFTGTKSNPTANISVKVQ